MVRNIKAIIREKSRSVESGSCWRIGLGIGKRWEGGSCVSLCALYTVWMKMTIDRKVEKRWSTPVFTFCIFPKWDKYQLYEKYV